MSDSDSDADSAGSEYSAPTDGLACKRMPTRARGAAKGLATSAAKVTGRRRRGGGGMRRSPAVPLSSKKKKKKRRRAAARKNTAIKPRTSTDAGMMSDSDGDYRSDDANADADPDSGAETSDAESDREGRPPPTVVRRPRSKRQRVSTAKKDAEAVEALAPSVAFSTSATAASHEDDITKKEMVEMTVSAVALPPVAAAPAAATNGFSTSFHIKKEISDMDAPSAIPSILAATPTAAEAVANTHVDAARVAAVTAALLASPLPPSSPEDTAAAAAAAAAAAMEVPSLRGGGTSPPGSPEQEHAKGKSGSWRRGPPVERICGICSKTLLGRGNFKVHMQEQHGHVRRTFACSRCSKVFARKYNLEVHLRTHADYRPFHCHYCDESFTQKSNLKRHVTTKHEKRFKCPRCKQRFPGVPELALHFERQHPGVPFSYRKPRSHVKPLKERTNHARQSDVPDDGGDTVSRSASASVDGPSSASGISSIIGGSSGGSIGGVDGIDSSIGGSISSAVQNAINDARRAEAERITAAALKVEASLGASVSPAQRAMANTPRNRNASGNAPGVTGPPVLPPSSIASINSPVKKGKGGKRGPDATGSGGFTDAALAAARVSPPLSPPPSPHKYRFVAVQPPPDITFGRIVDMPSIRPLRSSLSATSAPGKQARSLLSPSTSPPSRVPAISSSRSISSSSSSSSSSSLSHHGRRQHHTPRSSSAAPGLSKAASSLSDPGAGRGQVMHMPHLGRRNTHPLLALASAATMRDTTTALSSAAARRKAAAKKRRSSRSPTQLTPRFLKDVQPPPREPKSTAADRAAAVAAATAASSAPSPATSSRAQKLPHIGLSAMLHAYHSAAPPAATSAPTTAATATGAGGGAGGTHSQAATIAVPAHMAATPHAHAALSPAHVLAFPALSLQTMVPAGAGVPAGLVGYPAQQLQQFYQQMAASLPPSALPAGHPALAHFAAAQASASAAAASAAANATTSGTSAAAAAATDSGSPAQQTTAAATKQRAPPALSVALPPSANGVTQRGALSPASVAAVQPPPTRTPPQEVSPMPQVVNPALFSSFPTILSPGARASAAASSTTSATAAATATTAAAATATTASSAVDLSLLRKYGLDEKRLAELLPIIDRPASGVSPALSASLHSLLNAFRGSNNGNTSAAVPSSTSTAAGETQARLPKPTASKTVFKGTVAVDAATVATAPQNGEVGAAFAKAPAGSGGPGNSERNAPNSPDARHHDRRSSTTAQTQQQRQQLLQHPQQLQQPHGSGAAVAQMQKSELLRQAAMVQNLASALFQAAATGDDSEARQANGAPAAGARR